MAKDKPTVKELKLVKAIAAGKNQTEAGLFADPNRAPESARVWANTTLQKTTVQEALENAMVKHGIDLDTTIAPIGKALRAKRRDINGQGELVITDDLEMQLKGTDRALKLMRIGQDTQAPSIHFHQHLEEKRANYDF